MSNRILTPSKYLNFQEIEQFRKALDECSRNAQARNIVAPVRDSAMLHTVLGAGLRVSEAANLKLENIFISYGESELAIFQSKNNKSRIIKIGADLKAKLKAFLTWKRHNGEPMQPDSFVFLSERRGQMTTRAIQKRFHLYMTKAGIQKDCGIHSLRHTFALLLYRASGNNLRMVQKQLGHSSIATTQIYADVLAEDTTQAVNDMFKQVQQSKKPKKSWMPDLVEVV